MIASVAAHAANPPVRSDRPIRRSGAAGARLSIALKAALGVSALACMLPLAGVWVAGVASPVLMGYIAIICLLAALSIAALVLMEGVPSAALWPMALVVPACVFAGVAALGSAAAHQEELVMRSAQESLLAACLLPGGSPDIAATSACIHAGSLKAVRTASKAAGSLVNHKKIAASITKNL